MEYTVLKNFKDKYTNKYYGMGFSYESEDTERLAELERGGYIAAKDSEMAQMVEKDSTLKDYEAMGQNEQAPEENQTVADHSAKAAKAAQQAINTAEAKQAAQQAKAKAKAKNQASE